MKTAIRWGVWCIVLAAAYEVLEDSPAGEELIAGPVAAAICAAIMLRMFAVARTRYAVTLHQIVQLRAVPMTVVRDVFTVSAAIVRSFRDPDTLKGSVTLEAFEFGEEFEPRDAGRRAMETVRICLGPASVVCMIRPDEIAVHRMPATR